MAAGALVLGAAAFSPVAAQAPGGLDRMPGPTLRPRGQNVIPVYDGWFRNPDDTYTLCFSYFNLNTEEALDIPLGSENRVQPAQFDGVQPTHFDPVPDPTLTSKYRHYWCVFTVTVPGDFGNRDVVWTLTSQGDELSVPGSLLPAYVLDEITSPGRGAVAPFLGLEEGGPSVQGKRGVRAGPLSARVGIPRSLTAWVRHQDPGTWVGWAEHQGPGAVTFSAPESRLDAPEGTATTMATFDRPGRYVVRVQAINDPETRNNPTYSFEFHCCWTNGYIDIDVVE